MEPTGFFVIHISDSGQEHTPKVEAPASSDEPDETGVSGSGPLAQLGWMQGVPFLTALGSAGTVLVNATPIEPQRPVVIQAGDTITIGDTHLTWNPGIETVQPSQESVEAQASEVTVMLPRKEAGPPGPAIPAEPALAPEESDRPPTVQADGETLAVPGRPRGPTQAQFRGVTVVPPQKEVKPPRPDTPEPTLLVPKRPAEPPQADAPEPTLLVPKTPAEPPQAEPPEPTLLVPKTPAEPSLPEPPEPTLLVPKRPERAEPPLPEPLEPTLFVPKTPTGPPLPGTPDDKVVAPDEASAPPDDTATYRTAWVDMGQILEEDLDLDFEPTTILRDTQVPHLVFHLPNRTWEVQLTEESMTIGRGEANDIPISDESVSHHHALLERRGDDYLIRDTQSRNGVWLGRQRVEEHRLSNGDVLSLGRAKMVFKGGFKSDELTLIGAPRIDGRPARRPVVFVPGLMGTELWIGSECIWPDIRRIISNPEFYALPSDPRIEPRGIVNEVVIIPHIVEQRQYSAMGDHLVAGLGYTRGKDLLEFGYDWRQDVRLSAQRLAETIERWQVKAPLTIIGHSLGTLVTRYYVERLGGKRFVERIILMGGPHYGTPKGLAAFLFGPGMLPFGMGAERMRAVLATFPSSYQILPIYPCVVDQHGNHIDVLKDDSWLPEHQRPHLGAARSFRRELGTVSSVPAVSVFGYGLKTKLRVNVDRGPDGQWRKVDFVEDTAGDQSVPSGSAVLKDSEIHPVLQGHGSLYVDDDVRMRLKVELTRSTTWQRRK
jgi:pSer/pThr/pTyr-binding forkhead associated (FHA) protein/pimeloyl-ACP methyl ester carboxylesterase